VAVELTGQRPGRGRRVDRRGLTLVEVLIAAALLAVIMVGTVPLFTRAVIQNQVGWESSEVSSFARSETERFVEDDFNAADLTLTTGSELETDQHYSHNNHAWMPGDTPDTGDEALWVRTTTVRQYHVSALDDGILDPAEALPAGSAPEWVHLKQIVVEVQNRRGAALVRPDLDLSVQLVKAQ
jgi:prepilin-type N-terminal cleavage/methylation domain-containing protein